MTPRNSRPRCCQKSGVVLTCYVDGHKWFRSVALGNAPADPAENPEGAFAHEHPEEQNEGAFVNARRPPRT